MYRYKALMWLAVTFHMRVTAQVSSPLVSGWVWWPVFSWLWSSPTACIWSCSSALWTALMTPRVLPSLCPRQSDTVPQSSFGPTCRPHTAVIPSHSTSFACVLWHYAVWFVVLSEYVHPWSKYKCESWERKCILCGSGLFWCFWFVFFL